MTFRKDFAEGFSYIRKQKGVMRILVMSFFINYHFGVIRVLIIPWFTENPELGMVKYGFLNGAQSIGLITGMAILMDVTVEKKWKYRVYLSSLW